MKYTLTVSSDYHFFIQFYAFIISLIREVIKDMEDLEGDEKYGCKTMPIVWGMPAAKVLTALWIIGSIRHPVVLQFYAMHLGWWWSILYSVATIIISFIVPIAQLLSGTGAQRLSSSKLRC
ncbi:MAG: UbiA family prenyltransferase [Ferruginibacter sp.]